ncbi:hypothetical protein ECANGB1_2673 [Enterospora canceri]|uniref:Uncharacterized protein n=1 Tax=Enterospora canceri TaxID=1081671 RepID=A0A1Y1S4N7_9MICR|nr:hypothetical protein ECANGB1_2673 [Enterospora canceri]
MLCNLVFLIASSLSLNSLALSHTSASHMDSDTYSSPRTHNLAYTLCPGLHYLWSLLPLSY